MSENEKRLSGNQQVLKFQMPRNKSIDYSLENNYFLETQKVNKIHIECSPDKVKPTSFRRTRNDTKLSLGNVYPNYQKNIEKHHCILPAAVIQQVGTRTSYKHPILPTSFYQLLSFLILLFLAMFTG